MLRPNAGVFATGLLRASRNAQVLVFASVHAGNASALTYDSRVHLEVCHAWTGSYRYQTADNRQL